MVKKPSTPQQSNFRKVSVLLLAFGVVLLAAAFRIGISDNFPGIAAMLAGGFAVVLGIVWFFAKAGNRTPVQQLLFWAPRALCVMYALFISMFAMDVFGAGKGFWATALALLLHLMPTFLVLVLLVVSWRREWIGGSLFVILGILYGVWARHNPAGSWATIAIISGPLLLTGLLFLLNWRFRDKLRGVS